MSHLILAIAIVGLSGFTRRIRVAGGEAKVWQDEALISASKVSGGCGVLEHAHFRLYASPTLSSGTVYNDDLSIREVSTCP